MFSIYASHYGLHAGVTGSSAFSLNDLFLFITDLISPTVTGLPRSVDGSISPDPSDGSISPIPSDGSVGLHRGVGTDALCSKFLL